MRFIKKAAFAAAALGASAFLVLHPAPGGLVHPDHLHIPGVIDVNGISVGTDNAYCSMEFIGWSPKPNFSCEVVK